MSDYKTKPNHLKGQTSPYLLQHLYNPVDWYPWGEEALQKARKENKPLLISIGYSACHWCHVMEKESFEDPQVAQLMNQHFVCVKVDREERPDIDHLYMNAVQMISGRGGWPLNCFALPDARPFWGATYFQREQWIGILNRIAHLHQNQSGDLEEQAQKLTQGVDQSSQLPVTGNYQNPFEGELTDQMASQILKGMDMQHGGTRGAPKFPLPAVYEFLLHYHHQNPQNPKIPDAVLLSLEKMAMGGIYDQVGGGFARYSVDEQWKVPHFEKMLYDNAQLISLYAKAWKVSPDPLFRDVVTETLAFIHRELTSPEGVFYAALDADSEGEEGKYYVWKEQELEDVLGFDAQMAAAYFRVGQEGFWENGQNILLLTLKDDVFARDHHIDTAMLKDKVTQWKAKLLAAREKRIKPGLDHKIIVSWNALMIKALCDAYTAFPDDQYLAKALKATDHIWENSMGQHEKLCHILGGETAGGDGFLEDYATMIQALISLYQVSLHEKYVLWARQLLRYVEENFSARDTHLFTFSSARGEKLVAPYFDFHDNVIPAANSIMARNLFYMGHYFENLKWIERSQKMLADMRPHMEKAANWVANWGQLWLHHQKNFYTLAVCGKDAVSYAKFLSGSFTPDILVSGTSTPESILSLHHNRFNPSKTLVYPCTQHACLDPVDSPAEALMAIRK